MPNKKKSIEALKSSGSYRPGTHGKSHMDAKEVKSIPKPPACLKNKYAREEWKRITTELFHQGTLARIDYGALIMLCKQYGRFMGIDDYIEEKYESWEYYLEKVNSQTNTLGKAYDTAHDSYMKMMEKFGISPIGRSRIPIDPKKKPGSGLEQFL